PLLKWKFGVIRTAVLVGHVPLMQSTLLNRSTFVFDVEANKIGTRSGSCVCTALPSSEMLELPIVPDDVKTGTFAVVPGPTMPAAPVAPVAPAAPPAPPVPPVPLPAPPGRVAPMGPAGPPAPCAPCPPLPLWGPVPPAGPGIP